MEAVLGLKTFFPSLRDVDGPLARSYGLAYAYLTTYIGALPALVFLLDAPHGRFADPASALNINGNLGWLLMEIVSPLTFYFSLTTAVRFTALTLPTQILGGAFLLHYVNRSVIFTLQQRGARSPMHLIVPIMASTFNLANGHSLGIWLAGLTAGSNRNGAVPKDAFWQPLFALGMLIWFCGFVGNIKHDNILFRLRGSGKPSYSIPRGWLYDAPFGGISYPNYLCEWVEWSGFALAATFASGSACPPPFFASNRASARSWQAKLACPPWLFVLIELSTMLPRAVSGHRWYRAKFGDKLPRRRKAIFPGIL